METQITNAYDKIVSIYATEKGRKFIQHLIRAFLPINWSNITLAEQTCAITNKLGFSPEVFAEMTSESLFLRAKMTVGTEEEQVIARGELSDMFKRVHEYYKTEEKENIMETRKMLYSEKSDKYLSIPALIALLRFTENQIWCGDKNITYTVRSGINREFKQISQKEADIVAKKQTGMTTTLAENSQFQDLVSRLNLK